MNYQGLPARWSMLFRPQLIPCSTTKIPSCLGSLGVTLPDSEQGVKAAWLGRDHCPGLQHRRFLCYLRYLGGPNLDPSYVPNVPGCLEILGRALPIFFNFSQFFSSLLCSSRCFYLQGECEENKLCWFLNIRYSFNSF